MLSPNGQQFSRKPIGLGVLVARCQNESPGAYQVIMHGPKLTKHLANLSVDAVFVN